MASTKLAAPVKPVAPVAKPAAPAKPGAPVKPGAPLAKPAAAAPAKPVAAPKAAAPVAKPAAPAKPVAPAAKPAVAAKPAAPGKPTAPVAAKPAAAPKADDARFKEIGAILEALTAAVELHDGRLTVLETAAAGYGKFVSVGADGAIVFDLENADHETIRDWAYQLNACDWDADPEEIRAFLIATRDAKDFQGFTVVNELPRPGAGEAAPAGEQQITEEDIAKMNGTQLAELADQIGLDRSDKPSPKVLRNRILEALSGQAEGGEEATGQAEEPATEGDQPQLVEGETVLNVTYENEIHEVVFGGYNGEEIVVQGATLNGGEACSVPAELVSYPS